MAHTFLVHLSLHWTDMGADDISLWPFAVKHEVWLYNCVPNFESGLSPMELITKQKAYHRDIICSHVSGCPAYVLEPKLKMVRSFQSGIFDPGLGSSWGIQMSILLLLQMFGT